jgi:hypothetical protein
MSEGSFALSLDKPDTSDPPSPYKPGGVPRGTAFNKNVLVLPATPAMPTIDVACKVEGFDPASEPIAWRLQVLHVLGRFEKTSSDKKKGIAHYSGKVVRLADEWTGTSTKAQFKLFAQDENVTFDNASDRVAGGHAVLTVAAKPAGASNWLQDFAHLRITGSEPGEAAIRKYVDSIAAARHPNLIHMLNAIFAHESGFKQFATGAQTKTHFGPKGHKLLFDWPDDPPGYPVGAFDFGVGLSQFTHPDELTTAMAWDWRENMNAGVNVFLAACRRSHRPTLTWMGWAKKGWTGYNGSADYAEKRAQSDDGKKIPADKLPKGLNLAALTAPLKPAPTPPKPKWPVKTLAPEMAMAILAAGAMAKRSPRR